MVMDLENCFFHVRVHPAHQKFLGFKWPDPEKKEEVFFNFKVMVYGSKQAVSVVTRLIRPIVGFLHLNGIKFSIYIDDGRTSAGTRELTISQHNKVLETFKEAGWNLQMSKTSTIPTQILL